MKKAEELRNTPRLLVRQTSYDGGKGEVHFQKWAGSVIWSNGGGWEHVSIAPYKKHIVPTWDDMCMLKNIFFYDDEVAIQFHPQKSEYVNMVPNCLHLWRPIDEKLPLPNSLMVGVKAGQTASDVKEYMNELNNQMRHKPTITKILKTQ